ncbi:TRAP transporter large permease [Desulfovibrio sp. OttesenSCG-928-O18]|nr:TRAP transporter large permease [Desulfovibrio sp. OttesenSCG-928-O18]
MSVILLVLFAVLALLGMPLVFALGFASLGGLSVVGFDNVVLPQRMLHAVNSFPLMAIPLFMIAGELMVAAGIIKRLVDFANTLVGRMHGGMALVAIISGAIMAAVSGAAVASASALGSSLLHPLRKYYDDGYISAVIASAANLGPIIPPSNAMIVYALMAGSTVSVGSMFIAGIVPGLLIAVGLMVTASVISYKKGYPLSGEDFDIRKVWQQFKKAIIILLMPVIVVGGIIWGAFTPTEGAGIAVAYAALVGFFITRELKWKMIPEVLFRAALFSAIVGALIAFAATVTFVFTIDMVPNRVSAWIKTITTDPNVFIFLVMCVLIVAGMLLESNAAMIMLVPLLAPVAASYGIDPLYFGFLFVLNLMIGMMTPPVGVLLFVMAGITKVRIEVMVKSCLPFIAVQFAVLILVAAFPQLCLWLPRILGF